MHREVRFNLRGCANQLNHDKNDHVIAQMEKSTIVRTRRYQQRCRSKFRDQLATTTPTDMQQSLCSAKSISTTMRYVLYLSTLYLVVATNVCVFGVAAATAVATASTATNTTTATITIATFIANDSQRHGAVYAALSGAHSNVATTIDPGEYFIS